MSKLLGVTVEAVIHANGKQYALGVRSDDMKDSYQFERAVDALGASLSASVNKLIMEGSIDAITLPWRQ